MDNKNDYFDEVNRALNKSERNAVNYEDSTEDTDSHVLEDTLNDRTHKKKHSKKFKVLVGCGVTLLVLLLAAGGYVWHLLGFYNHKDFANEEVVYQKEEFDTTGEKQGYATQDPNTIIWNKYADLKKVEGVTNILLCAEENQYHASRGRADVIIIATIDSNKNSLKLTSIMRDTYVQIPGFKDNRINSSYKTGDIPLLEETIKNNFNIEVDGYVKVDFDSFTKIIDALGGVEITLTADEAEWLNQSNHILDKNSRNVTEGTHILNGSQALGYSRIRKVRTADGTGSDWGRIWRQKHVLSQVFDKYKKQSVLDILGMAPDILELVQTDYSKTEVLSLVKTVMDLNIDEIETFSVPVKHGYEPKTVRGMEVLVPDLRANSEALSDFIYGSDTTKTASGDDSNKTYN